MKEKSPYKLNYGKTYSELHAERQKNFPGYTVKRYAQDITKLVKAVQPRNILDYGSGKGYQYLKYRIHEVWGGILPVCFDVGVRQLRDRPEQKFDGVICTDMLEHIEQDDMRQIIGDIFSFLTKEDRPTFAFFAVSCRLSEHKTLPDGRNVHLTVQPPDWWRELFKECVAATGLSQLIFKAGYEDADGKVIRD